MFNFIKRKIGFTKSSREVEENSPKYCIEVSNKGAEIVLFTGENNYVFIGTYKECERKILKLYFVFENRRKNYICSYSDCWYETISNPSSNLYFSLCSFSLEDCKRLVEMNEINIMIQTMNTEIA